ncbi:hypothetical protein V8F20_001052 [Naviculisporaceae sp. PSN 640]
MHPIRWTILCSALLGTRVQSLAFPGPDPTLKVVIPLNAQSPRTTDPPAVPEILRRQSGSNRTDTLIHAPDNTCGYISGRLGASLACYSTRTCVFVPSQELRGCCDETDCGFLRACRDIEEASNSRSCDDGCLMDTLTLKCTETSFPFCNTALFLGSISDFFCNSLNISTPQRVETTWSGQTDRTLITELVDRNPPTTTSTEPPTAFSEPGTTRSSSSAGPPSSSSSIKSHTASSVIVAYPGSTRSIFDSRRFYCGRRSRWACCNWSDYSRYHILAEERGP